MRSARSVERPRVQALLRYATLGAGILAFFLVRDELDATVLQRPAAIGLAFGLSLLGVVGGAFSWAVLIESPDRSRALDAFIAAQPAKYLPAGGAIQVAAQIGLSASSGSVAATSGMAVTHALLQVITALSLGVASLFAFLPGGSPVVITLSAVVMVGIALYLLPRLIRPLANRFAQRYDLEVPPARGLVQSVSLTLIPLVCAGIAFDTLAGGSLADSIPATIAAFSAAWAIGFIALPLPSGLFVRESVLLVLLDIDLPDLVAVSLAHRTAVLAAEFSLMVLFAARGAVIRGRRP